METTQTPLAERPPAVSTPAELRRVYLARLERLHRLRHQHQQELNRQGLRLLDRSLFAAYCACRDIGAEAEARAILRGTPIDHPGDANGSARLAS